MRETDAIRLASEFDELVGIAWLLGGAILGAKSPRSRAGTRRLCIQCAVKDALAVLNSDDAVAVAALVQKQGFESWSLFGHVNR